MTPHKEDPILEGNIPSPQAFAAEMQAAIDLAILAHSRYPKEPGNAIRYWDRVTPYAIHPIWCAMTLLTETRLPAEVRIPGYQALLWHDVLEDTDLPLPEGIDERVRKLVEEMTFASFAEEQEKLWERSETARLLKLYDKVSILLDAAWMRPKKWNTIVEHTLKLKEFVVERYGELNIVRIADVMAVKK